MEMFSRFVEKTNYFFYYLKKAVWSDIVICIVIWSEGKMKYIYCTVQFVELIEWQGFFLNVISTLNTDSP